MHGSVLRVVGRLILDSAVAAGISLYTSHFITEQQDFLFPSFGRKDGVKAAASAKRGPKKGCSREKERSEDVSERERERDRE